MASFIEGKYNLSHIFICVRDDIKSPGKFAIFTRLKTEGGGGPRHISEKLPLKIQIVKDIDVKITLNDLEGNRDET